jgi:Uma2 family endonuclease
MATDTKYELIEGVVYMASPAKKRHGRHTKRLILWLGVYEEATPGVEVLDNTTAILDDINEPQPDVAMLILPEHGGQTGEEDEWMLGAPEFVAEVASTTASYDLYAKKRVYQSAGVCEYLVVLPAEKRVLWFVSSAGTFEELKPGPDGLYRSEAFPGLWLEPGTLFGGNLRALRKVARAGVATPEHREFVRRLKQAKKR